MASLNCILHPHHVTLMDHPHNFQSFRRHFDDPYYIHESVDGHSHRGVVAPKFDVYGGQTAYLLNGELPGVADRKEIRINWLTNQTLVVQGYMRPEIQPDWENGLGVSVENGTIPSKVAQDATAKFTNGGSDSVTAEPKTWLRERPHGEFERSFTFPTDVQHEGVRARLEDGVLRIIVYKASPSKAEQMKRIPIE
jgi:HSP20 family molecular chaperone IbpA